MSATAEPVVTVDGGSPRRSAMVEQLPRVLAQDHFVRSYVGLCDEIWESVLERIDDLEWFLDPGVAPIAFVQWLGRWLGVTVDPTLPEDRQRALVRTAGQTLQWRGTRHRVQLLLEALTGTEVELADDGGVVAGDDPPRASNRVAVRLTSAGGLSEAQLLDIVASEVPANATVTLSVDAEPIEAPPAEDEDDAVLAAPEPHGDEGFLPPMRGRITTDDDPWPDGDDNGTT